MAKKYKRNVNQSAVRKAPTAGEVPAAPVEKAAAATPYSRRTAEFNPDYTYVINDLKRIGVLAGSFFVILVVLSFILK